MLERLVLFLARRSEADRATQVELVQTWGSSVLIAAVRAGWVRLSDWGDFEPWASLTPEGRGVALDLIAWDTRAPSDQRTSPPRG